MHVFQVVFAERAVPPRGGAADAARRGEGEEVDVEGGEVVQWEGVRAEREEAGEEAGEVLERVGGDAVEGVGDVEEVAGGREVEEVGYYVRGCFYVCVKELVR